MQTFTLVICIAVVVKVLLVSDASQRVVKSVYDHHPRDSASIHEILCVSKSVKEWI